MIFFKQNNFFFDFKYGNKIITCHPNNTIFLVLSMGKTGTYTVHESLNKEFPFKKIYRGHALTIGGIWDYEKFKKNGFIALHEREFLQIIADNRVNIKIVIPIRDLFEREISSFFHNIQTHIPNKLHQTNEIIIKKLINSTSSHSYALNWFDNELLGGMKINVYDYPFDKETGSIIIKENNVEILIFRLEDINKVFKVKLKDFFYERNIEIISSNRTKDKDIGEKYIQFKTVAKFPKVLVSKFYTSKFMKHFYSQEYIQEKEFYWINKFSNYGS